MDIVDGDVGGTPLVINNLDGDSNVNFLDIDSDDDGIVDNIESQTTTGYFSPSGIDANDNGLDDAYEGVGYIIPTNTDGADSPDYLDLDSDNDSFNDYIEVWDLNNDGVINSFEPVFSAFDSDSDGLVNNYDANDAALNPTNGQTPFSFPNFDNAATEGNPLKLYSKNLTLIPSLLVTSETSNFASISAKIG